MALDARLFGRVATITLDTLEIPCGVDGFRCSFDIEKDLTGKPNTASVKVWNLSADHRAELLAKATKKSKAGKPAGVRVKVEAGYKDGKTSRLFEGDLRYINHEHDGPEVITHVETGDGEYWVNRSRITKAWGPGTAVSTVIQEVAQAIGVGDGNLLKAIQGAELQGWGPTFTQGTVASGRAVKELNRLTKSAGLEWSIQDGTLQVLGSGKSLDKDAVLLSSDTGLVGTPTIDHKGVVSIKMLLIPDVFPGRKIKLDGIDLQGFYVVKKAKYQGDTAGNDWYIDTECKAL